MEPSSKWNTHQNGILILSKWNTHIKKEHSSKWNTHQNGILIKMEYSYYQNGTLILKRNTHIIKRNIHIKKELTETPRQGTLHLWLLLSSLIAGLGVVPSSVDSCSPSNWIIKWDTSDSFPKSTPSPWYCLPRH